MKLKEAITKVKARIKCDELSLKGDYNQCNDEICDECDLCYEQGNMGERLEALKEVVSAAEDGKRFRDFIEWYRSGEEWSAQEIAEKLKTVSAGSPQLHEEEKNGKRNG